MHISIPYHHVSITGWVHQDKQENVMEIWHLCVFHVLLLGRLQSPHCSTQIWWSSVEQKLQWTFKSYVSGTSWIIQSVSIALHFAFCFFPPKFLAFPSSYFYAQMENAHKNRWIALWKQRHCDGDSENDSQVMENDKYCLSKCTLQGRKLTCIPTLPTPQDPHL